MCYFDGIGTGRWFVYVCELSLPCNWRMRGQNYELAYFSAVEHQLSPTHFNLNLTTVENSSIPLLIMNGTS